jgi:hypothetical protein
MAVLRIRDVNPKSGFFISDPDPGVQKALDPGSATLYGFALDGSFFI